MIVGWSTALRGEVINEKSRATPEETGSRPARAGKDRIITHPIGDETGWTTARSLSEVGATSVHSKPVFACSDCTFLDEIHRAALDKKRSRGRRAATPGVCPKQSRKTCAAANPIAQDAASRE